MCGIVGGIAQRDVLPVLLEGLKRLEYRGYDSAGVAVIDDGTLHRVRVVGKIKSLVEQLSGARALAGGIGIAHTRWATHGSPGEANAHPHICRDELALVHNGIIENHEPLREDLSASGYEFTSETDSEIIVCLIHRQMSLGDDLLAAVQHTVPRLKGAYAIGVIHRAEPHRLVAVRCGSPLVIGAGIEECFMASDIAALLPVTRSFIVLEEGDVADIRRAGPVLYDRAGAVVERPRTLSEQAVETVDKAGYRHHMQKEIFVQPQSITDTLEGRIDDEAVVDTAFGEAAREMLARVAAVRIVACGTSFHAALVAQHWLETLAAVPCSVEVASEYRYRKAVTPENCLFVCVSQSGETADTLAALRQAEQAPYLARLAICNVPESSLTRAADLVFLTRAGTEIGVASTKAFTTQLAGLFLLALSLAEHRGMAAGQRATLLHDLRKVPSLIDQVLARQGEIRHLAEDFIHCRDVLYIGRGLLLPIAMEGALKLKEISYIHAEAYPGGELKHGPLALVDDAMQVVSVAGSGELLEKMKSNLAEIKSRGGRICLFTDEQAEVDAEMCAGMMRLPTGHAVLSPFPYTVALQLLAYHTAVLRGADVDQPRNLAKSVTVE